MASITHADTVMHLTAKVVLPETTLRQMSHRECAFVLPPRMARHQASTSRSPVRGGCRHDDDRGAGTCQRACHPGRGLEQPVA